MPATITQEIIESFIACNLKGHLKLIAENEEESDIGECQRKVRSEYRDKATASLLHLQGNVEPCEPSSTSSVLTERHPVLFDFILEADDVSFRCDALRRMPGASRLGDFFYAPVLYVEGKSAQAVRLKLALCGALLESLQGRYPENGFIVHGQGCALSRVLIDPKLKAEAEQLLQDIRAVRSSGSPPKLALNDHCPSCEFRVRCLRQATDTDDLSLLRGMSKNEIGRQNKKGIFTVTQLSCTFRPRRQRKQIQRKLNPHQFSLQAMAIRDKKIYVFGNPSLPQPKVCIYFDIEGNPNTGIQYLLGLFVCDGESEHKYFFWADDKEHEVEAFRQLLDVVSAYNDYRIFHYGSYEAKYLRRMEALVGDQRTQQLIANSVNVLGLIYGHVYFPVYYNGLKDIGNYIGFSWSDPSASGMQSIVWRDQWEASKDQSLKDKLIQYNLEDCVALKRITEVLFGIVQRAEPNGEQFPASVAGLPVEFTKDIVPYPMKNRWGRVNFVFPDMEYVNKCAYFDYQRERVVARSTSIARRSISKRISFKARKFRINKRIEVQSCACPHCGSTKLEKGTQKFNKRAFDLRITPGGIARQVVEVTAARYSCAQCKQNFLPPEFKRRAMHLHTLKSWAMQQHVANRSSLRDVGRMFTEFFGLHVERSYLHMFKSQMAQEYQETYQTMMDRLLSGPLIHADETEMPLKSGKVYVWVFTSLMDVVYMRRPNREGGFLQEMLKPFKGVLVSDFYTAYDSLPCQHQKCLIHLIRDFNDELLHNPFDEELKSVVGGFGKVLRATVQTIDRHGLKRLHLKRHDGEIARFFCWLEDAACKSEIADKVRNRLLKNRDRLFTFVQQDGIPWNNNNAENAIKQFAYYRENVINMMSEGGLNDYLTLLSIAQSCRYRGVSFLRFLMSRKKDIAEFAAGNQLLRAPTPIIEAYPIGFPCPNARERNRKSDTQPIVDASANNKSMG